MKKYTKPMIIFESFTLSTNIAGDCGRKADGPTGSFAVNGCGIYYDTFNPFPGEFDTMTIFTAAWSGCIDNVSQDDSLIDQFCYHNPSDSTKLFNS